MTLRQVWKSMPRSEKLLAIFGPFVFMALFWAVWVMTP